MWIDLRVSVSEHCRRFGNCLGLAIPARRIDHCFARLLQYLRASTKRTSRASDVGLGIASKLRRNLARHMMKMAQHCATSGGWSDERGEPAEGVRLTTDGG
jgi:hypothetical protein